MLTQEEESFINWWQANRDRQKKKRNRLLIGLPAGLMLGLPILLNVFARWNKRVALVTGGQMIVLIIAVLAIITFMSVFSVQHKWEMREQLYHELLQKKRAGETPQQNTFPGKEKAV
jgi:uncharacterized membrane protein